MLKGTFDHEWPPTRLVFSSTTYVSSDMIDSISFGSPTLRCLSWSKRSAYPGSACNSFRSRSRNAWLSRTSKSATVIDLFRVAAKWSVRDGWFTIDSQANIKPRGLPRFAPAPSSTVLLMRHGFLLEAVFSKDDTAVCGVACDTLRHFLYITTRSLRLHVRLYIVLSAGSA